MTNKFYDCKFLFESKDKYGNDPTVRIVMSRGRSYGKTYSIAKRLLNHSLNNGRKFILLTRVGESLGNIAVGRLKSVVNDLYPKWSVLESVAQKNAFSNIFLTTTNDESEVVKEHIGYGVAINACSKIKDISSTFIDVDTMWFDEFLPKRQNEYISKEVELLIDIYKSVARGNGESSRYVQLVLSANALTMRNPYFTALHLYGNVHPDTKWYRGDSIVYQKFESDVINQEHKLSGINKAFSQMHIINYEDGGWQDDNKQYDVCKSDNWGFANYIGTIYLKDKVYAVKYYSLVGLYYVDKSPDLSHPIKFKANIDSGTEPLLKNTPTHKKMRKEFEAGKYRFKDATTRDDFVYEIL